MSNSEAFQPYEKLIEIMILGTPHLVPENNSILRCFQFLAMESISYGDFCWNGDCLNCTVWIESNDKEKPVIACRTNAFEGMKILRLADAIDLSTD